VSYRYRKLDWLLTWDFWAELTFLYKSGFLAKFCHDPPRNLYTKDVANEPNFLLVTHPTSFDIRINRYEFLKSAFAAEQILGRLTIQVFDQNFGPQDE
jgi:hypothetical protein